MVSSINYRYPTLERLDSHPEYGDKNNKSAVSSFIAKRHKAQYREVNTQDKIKWAEIPRCEHSVSYYLCIFIK